MILNHWSLSSSWFFNYLGRWREVLLLHEITTFSLFGSKEFPYLKNHFFFMNGSFQFYQEGIEIQIFLFYVPLCIKWHYYCKFLILYEYFILCIKRENRESKAPIYCYFKTVWNIKTRFLSPRGLLLAILRG